MIDGLIVHGSRRIPYRLYLRARKGLRISVTSRLEVNVFAPRRASREWVVSAIQDKASWIATTVDRVASREILSLPESYAAGDPILFLGSQYRLVIVPGRSNRAEILFDALVITVPDTDDARAIGRAVLKWYRLQAKDIFRQTVSRCLPRLRDKDVASPPIRIRDMRSRWGSCSSDGRLALNLKLAMVRPDLIEYVVMHELCHLVHHDHSKRYYALLARCMPDWKDRRELLGRYRLI